MRINPNFSPDSVTSFDADIAGKNIRRTWTHDKSYVAFEYREAVRAGKGDCSVFSASGRVNISRIVYLRLWVREIIISSFEAQNN